MTHSPALVYLDNASTSWPKAPGVPEAVAATFADPVGNPGRGMISGADRIVFETRTAAARLFGLHSSERLLFTPSATASLNLVLRGMLRPGDLVVVSAMEHNSVMRPLRFLERSLPCRVRVFDCDRSGLPVMASFRDALAARPALLVTIAASNVTGCLFPFREMAALAARETPSTLVCIDAAQAAGEIPIDLSTFPCDFLCVAPHKGLLAPAGVGLLLLGPRVDPPPLVRGGTGSMSESEEQPDFLPDRYEGGTRNIPGIAGLGAALRWIEREGIATLSARSRRAAGRLREGIATIPGLALYGPESDVDRLPLLSVTHATVPIDELAAGLAARAVVCRHGLHCAPAAHGTIGTRATGGTVRFSPGPFTTDADVDAALSALREIGDPS